METLLELLPRIRSLGAREAIRFSDGIRTEIWSYQELDLAITRFVGHLKATGFGPGDRLLLWSENRPEWIAVFWACLIQGVVVVPVDASSTPKRVSQIQGEAGTELLVRGQATAVPPPAANVFRIQDLTDLPLPSDRSGPPIKAADIVQILYTSGTTAEPKGVVHRHRNICSNLTPIGREIHRYRHWARPFQPVRLLDMVPLSHMFGQSMGIFIPLLLEGSVVFMTGLHPATIRRTIRSQGISVLVTVPHVLETLRSDVERRHPETGSPRLQPRGVMARWWHYRSVHREFGWKFWAFVVGGASLNASVEEYWARIGLLVIQGYGLTETSPVVTANHPLRARRGTIGRSLGNQEITIADDGEIWVRGPSVVEEYVHSGSSVRPTTDADGWFHTGDIGEMDSEGNVIYRGRKKDIIVTADGLNVYPDDVEDVLNNVAGVRDSAVIAVQGSHGEVPHAVLILDTPRIDPAPLIEAGNRLLEPGQRIRSWSVWPDEDFPRTLATLKVQRRLVLERVVADPAGSGQSSDRDPSSLIALVSGLRGARGADVTPNTHMTEDLGLSSLERIDLLAGVEARYGIELDETEFSEASTIAELEAQVAAARRHLTPNGVPLPRRHSNGELSPPRWSRSIFVRAFRSCVQTTLILPLLRTFVRISVEGLENLETIRAPVLFASNHASHLDTPVILKGLPRPWRGRLAPAMREEYFRQEAPALIGRLGYILASLTFNTYPLPQQLGRVGESLRYTGELVSSGYCPLIFPEGKRTTDGALGPLRTGVGLMAVRLRISVVPLLVEGTFELLPLGAGWPKRGRVRLKIGAPIRPEEDESYASVSRRLEAVLRSMA